MPQGRWAGILNREGETVCGCIRELKVACLKIVVKILFGNGLLASEDIRFL
jgi:hypothetical protein